MKFDDVLNQIGGFGRFQKILYVWICLPQILLAFHMFVSIFTGATPPHLCLSTWPPPPGQEPSFNFSHSEFSCSPEGLAGRNLSLGDEALVEEGPGGCKGGWEYSKEVFHSTVVTEWDLVCHDAKLNNIGSSIYMFGLLVGAVVFGALADKYGRRTIILVGLALQATFGVGAAFAPNFYIYVALRFVVGTTISAVIMNAFVLGTEWTGLKHRMLAGIITDYFFGFGYIMLAGVAYLIRDWRHLQLAISAPGFLFIFYIWVLPKSARWLMANSKNQEALDLIRRAALINGNPLEKDLKFDKNGKSGKTMSEERKYSVMDLVRTPKMRRQTLIVLYLWFVNVLVYYGLSLNIADFGTNMYVTHVIFGLVEMPARTITLFTLNRSRQISQLAFLTVGGLACLLTIFIPDDLPMMRSALAMVGKFGITASLSIIYVYSAEIFPTVVRQSGIGMGSMCARAGGVLAPIIYLMKHYNLKAPMVVFGLCPLLGAALTVLLPETANKALPDTIEEVEGEGFTPSEEKEKCQEPCLKSVDIVN